jgi:tRNA A-37 threonylcarbamoyl transferase component Bud32
MREALEETVVSDREETAASRRGAQREPDGDSSFDETGSDNTFDPDDADGGLPAPLSPDGQGGKRFVVRGTIGKGASGKIYEVVDRALDRVIAVKRLALEKARRKGRVEQFIREARTTARLEHPNILPVYDIGTTDERDLFFSMRRVDGQSLGAIIAAAETAEEPPESIASINDRIGIILKVCDALGFAHSKQVIHQDIKPDNIMLGDYGEVLLLDWGSSRPSVSSGDSAVRQMVGTPAYMSPEQARREKVDRRSDIYCLGATLFHLLYLRHPTWADTPERFWEKKRRGTIDPLTIEEKTVVPGPLADIVHKALHPDPARRYGSVRELGDDLRRFQAGQAVSAHRDTVGERVRRWYRGNRRFIWVVALAAVLVTATGGLFFREKLKELFFWHLIYTESFDSVDAAALNSRWLPLRATGWTTDDSLVAQPIGDSTTWRLHDGKLMVSYHERGFTDLAFRMPSAGNIRVEWDVLSRRKNQNINCFIGAMNRWDGYTFHVGGWNNPRFVGLTKGRHYNDVLDYTILKRPLEIGRRYHFRMERENQNVRLFIDKALVIDYRDPDMLSGPEHQGFGFDNVSGGELALDNVRVYRQALPEKISPLEVAASYFQKGLWEEARRQYGYITEQHPDSWMVPVARYKSALCHRRLGHDTTAYKQLRQFEMRYPSHDLIPFALYERSKILAQWGHKADVESVYVRIAREYPGHSILRTIFFRLTEEMYDAVSSHPEPSEEEIERGRRVIVSFAKLFGVGLEQNQYLAWAAKVAYNREQYTEVLRRYPEQRNQVARALFALGRYQEIIDTYPDLRRWCAEAMTAQGRYDEVIEEFSEYPDLRGEVLLRQRRYEDALRIISGHPNTRARTLMALGRPEAVLALPASAANFKAQAHMMLGQADEVLLDDKAEQSVKYWALQALGREAEIGELIPGHRRLAVEAFTLLGRYDEALAQARDDDTAMAKLFLNTGRFERVLGLKGELRGYVDQALLETGQLDAIAVRMNNGIGSPNVYCASLWRQAKHERILEEQTGQIYWRCLTLAISGRVDEAIRQTPVSHRYREATLLNLAGRHEEVVRYFRDEPQARATALLAMGQVDSVLEHYDFLPAMTAQARCLKAIMLWSAGDKETARAVLSSQPWLRYGEQWLYSRFGLHLMPAVLERLDGKEVRFRSRFAHLLETGRYHFARKLWHEAAYLAGVITGEEFLNQPSRLHAQSRLLFLEAVRKDCDGLPDEARAAYRRFLDVPMWEREKSLVERRFAAWRIEALTENGMAGEVLAR